MNRSGCYFLSISESFRSNIALFSHYITVIHDKILSQEVKMSARRRYAPDFTDSLNSFRQTISQKELNQAVSETSSENTLDSVKNKEGQDDRYTRSRNNVPCTGSVILAASSTSQQFSPLSLNNTEENCNNNKHPLLRENTLSVSDETSYLSIKSDLNKCINLFDNEYLCKECDDLQEQLNTSLYEITVREDINSCHLNKNKTTGQQDPSNRQRSMSTGSLRNIILFNEKLKRFKSCTALDRALKRNTNYNIKGDQLCFPIKSAMKVSYNDKIETVVSALDVLSVSKPALLCRKDDTIEEVPLDSINSETSSQDEINPSELKILLHSLADQKSLKEAAMQQRLLRRLSSNYCDSPKVFTERLLTIIEESVINNDSCPSLQNPEDSLCRFNEELRKMCKFIDDETVPEWPQFPGMPTSICAKRKSQEPDLLQKSFTLSPDKALCSTQCNIKSSKQAYRRISKNTSIVKSLYNSTNTFESLEAMCKNLYSDGSPSNFPAKQENRSQSPLQNMDDIWRTRESQMASLEDSPNIHEQIEKAGICTSDSAYQHNETSEAQNLHDSTNTFESLEAMCKKFYSDNSPSNFPVRQENRSQSALQNMDDIWRTCKSQMASLGDLPNIHEQIKKAGTCTSHSAQNLQYKLSSEEYDRMDLKGVSDTLKQRTKRDKFQETIKLDDLESTLMYEIAKKRQRCLNTAKVMMEIDVNLESTEEVYSNTLSTASSSTRTDDKFMKTLMCVKTYEDYLEKQVSLLNLLHRAKLSNSRTLHDKKDVRARKMRNENVNTCTLSTLLADKQLRTPRLSPRKKSTSPSTKHHSTSKQLKTVVSKPRLFITPGKTPVNKSYKPKRTYFPNLLPRIDKKNKSNTSPQAKNIYRQLGNYDHVKSPVAMYIKGTESHVIKNPRSKTDEVTEKEPTDNSRRQ